MHEETKTSIVLTVVTIVFVALAVYFLTEVWKRDREPPLLLMVDPEFLDTSPVRMNYPALVKAGEEIFDYDCYICHSRNETIQLEFDEFGEVILEEHDYLTFNHGPARENYYCFNCHDREQLDRLRTQYGRLLTFDESSEMCGSCHGITYRDWQVDAHGRASGYWDITIGERKRLDCTECHDPHNTRFPSLKPAPGPHSMRGRTVVAPDND